MRPGNMDGCDRETTSDRSSRSGTVCVVLPHLGYLIATFTVMLTLFTLYGRRHTVLAFTGSLLVSVVSYFVFHELLRVQLPAGLPGFGG